MSIPPYDFHMHTHFSDGKPEMTIPAILERCEALGVQKLAVTDHLEDWSTLERHPRIRQAILDAESSIDIYFGAELDFLGYEQGFPMNEETKIFYGFQILLAGVHRYYTDEYNPARIMDIFHRHYLRVCADPLVDILVHPYFFPPGNQLSGKWPAFDTMKIVPQSHIRELAQAAKETGTAIEVNGSSCLTWWLNTPAFTQEYKEYLAALNAEGVTFSVGSDAHALDQLGSIQTCWETLESLGVPAERIWAPSCEPLVKGRK
jgi:histidinol phosphatase-like PHP family hydrolase